MIEKAPLKKLVNVKVLCEDVSKKKPDPEVYLKVMDSFGCKAEDCVVFEDSLNGVISAKEAGIDVVAIYDDSAINAIHRSEPFGEFPANTAREYITVNYSFDTKLIKTDKVQDLYNLAKKHKYSDKKQALDYINQAISEVGTDEESYVLYNFRGKLKEALGDYVGAKSDFEQYKKFKSRVDIKRLHALKYQAEQEDSAFIYYYLAYAYEQVEDYENAIKSIDKAIERTDLNQQYKRYRSYLVKKSLD